MKVIRETQLKATITNYASVANSIRLIINAAIVRDFAMCRHNKLVFLLQLS